MSSQSSNRHHSASDRRQSGSRSHNSGRHRTPENDVPNLKSQSYTGRELARLLRRNATRTIWDKLTPTEADIMREPLPEWAQAHGLDEVTKYLKEYLHILDQVFFFGGVKKHIRKFKVVDMHDPDRDEGEEGSWHYATRLMKINLYQSSRSVETSLWEHYVATLVHEMLHAFLDCYSCHCRKCKWNRSNSRGGRTGHGAVWCNAMIAIQDSMVRDLSWRIICGISESVDLECRKTGWIPRDDQLRRWRVTLDPALQRRAHTSEAYEDADAEEEGDDDGDDYETPYGVQVLCCTVM